MNKRKAQISLYHLFLIVEKDIAGVVNALISIDPLPNALSIPLFKYTVIRTCAFYYELTKHTKEALESTELRFIAFRDVYDYIISQRDAHFPDLYSIRNNGLAHNYRIRRENDRSIFEKETSYTFPKSAAELILNYKLMDTVLSAIRLLYLEIEQILNDNLHVPLELITQVTESNYQEFINEIEQESQRIFDEALKTL